MNKNTRFINECAAVLAIKRAVGGTFVVPRGVWWAEPFNMTHNMTLLLEEHAHLKPKPFPLEKWPSLQPLPSYGTGREGHAQRYASFVQGFNLTNITITGQNGTIHGNGKRWWNALERGELKHSRGHLFECVNCRNVRIKNVT